MCEVGMCVRWVYVCGGYVCVVGMYVHVYMYVVGMCASVRWAAVVNVCFLV